METIIKNLVVQSMAFANNGHIPPKYTCEGENVNPPLEISDIPEDTKSLALIMEDPDAPGGDFTHWLIWNVSPSEEISENSNQGISGMNDFGKTLGYKKDDILLSLNGENIMSDVPIVRKVVCTSDRKNRYLNHFLRFGIG